MSDKDREAFEKWYLESHGGYIKRGGWQAHEHYKTWQAALAHASCPHVFTGKDGTSHCTLAASETALAAKDAEIERLNRENCEIRGHNQGLADALKLDKSKFWRLVERLEESGYKIPDEWFDGAAAQQEG